MNPFKSAIAAFILSMGGFLVYYLIANANGSAEMDGLQSLGHIAMPVSAGIAAVIFIAACLYKVTSRGQ